MNKLVPFVTRLFSQGAAAKSPVPALKTLDAANQVGKKAGVGAEGGLLGYEKLSTPQLRAELHTLDTKATEAFARYKETGDYNHVRTHAMLTTANLNCRHHLVQRNPQTAIIKAKLAEAYAEAPRTSAPTPGPWAPTEPAPYKSPWA